MKIGIKLSFIKKGAGPTEIRTRVVGFKVQSDSHYTIGPATDSLSMNVPFLRMIRYRSREGLDNNIFYLTILIFIPYSYSSVRYTNIL